MLIFFGFFDGNHEADRQNRSLESAGASTANCSACSVIAAAIILERLWTLQQKRVIPVDLTRQVWDWVKKDQLNPKHINSIHQSSPLGQILASGLNNRHRDRDTMKESIEDTGRHVVHELERYLNTLGTIAAISPLLGLLGTVIGMILAFRKVASMAGFVQAPDLAEGIYLALVTTVEGLIVAIPSLAAFAVFRNRVDQLVAEASYVAAHVLAPLKRVRAAGATPGAAPPAPPPVGGR